MACVSVGAVIPQPSLVVRTPLVDWSKGSRCGIASVITGASPKHGSRKTGDAIPHATSGKDSSPSVDTGKPPTDSSPIASPTNVKTGHFPMILSSIIGANRKPASIPPILSPLPTGNMLSDTEERGASPANRRSKSAPCGESRHRLRLPKDSASDALTSSRSWMANVSVISPNTSVHSKMEGICATMDEGGRKGKINLRHAFLSSLRIPSKGLAIGHHSDQSIFTAACTGRVSEDESGASNTAT